MMNAPLCTIVGMGPGISLAVARRFSAQGLQIGFISRDAEALRGFERELAGSRGVVADAADETALRGAVRALGPASVLVYNVSSGHAGWATRLRPEDALADFRINVAGALAAIQEVVPGMREAGRGTIFITGGGLALKPMGEHASLSMGKAAQRSLAFSLAEELEPAGVHVATVTVCGFVQSGTRFSPENIAEEFWRLHSQPPGQFEREVIYE